MNAYFEKNNSFDSNRRTFKSYYEEVSPRANAAHKAAELLLSLLSALLRIITHVASSALVKVLSFALCFVGFVGVIGAMEHGSLGMGAGLLIGAGLVAFELLLLRTHRA